MTMITFIETLRLRLFSFLSLPILFMVAPRITSIDEKTVSMLISCKRFNRSHLKALSFSSISTGTECAAGYLIGKHIIDNRLAYRWVVNHSKIELTHPIKTDGTFVATLQYPVSNYIALCGEHPLDIPVSVLCLNAAKEICGSCVFNVRITPPRK